MLDSATAAALMQTTRSYLFVFAALTFAGGLLGFLKAKSNASLVAGSVSAVLLALAAWLCGTATPLAGLLLGLFVSAALAARFGRAYAKTRKTMPAAPMALLGVLGVILTVLSLLG